MGGASVWIILFTFLCAVLSYGLWASYALLFWGYYAAMLPFFVLGYPLKHLIFGFNLYSFVFVSQGLASLYVCLFPQIKECMPFGYGKIENIEPEDILPRVVKSFEIKPKNIMSVVPLLVHKRKNCWEGCLDALMLCCLIFAMNMPISLIPLLSGCCYFWKKKVPFSFSILIEYMFTIIWTLHKLLFTLTRTLPTRYSVTFALYHGFWIVFPARVDFNSNKAKVILQDILKRMSWEVILLSVLLQCKFMPLLYSDHLHDSYTFFQTYFFSTIWFYFISCSQ